MAYHHYKTEAVFLKKEERGEADVIFTLFSREFGKVEVLAKSVRKITSKLRGSCELFSLASITFIQGKNQKTLTDVALIDNFSVLKDNQEALFALTEISQKIIDFTYSEEKDLAVWRLLKEVFLTLAKNQDKYFLAEQYFFWNLLKLAGLLPQVYHCCLCSKKLLPEVLFFCFEEGGAVCWQCKKGIAKELPIKEVSVNIIKIIRFLTESPLQKCLKLKINKKDGLLLQEINTLVAKPA